MKYYLLLFYFMYTVAELRVSWYCSGGVERRGRRRGVLCSELAVRAHVARTASRLRRATGGRAAPRVLLSTGEMCVKT